MRKLALVGVVGIGVLLATVPGLAHHSFSAEFDIDKPVTLRGTLTKIAWTNPHGWLYMGVTGPDGTLVHWAVEMRSPSALLKRGLRVSDFPPGIELVVEGYLAKDGTPTANGIAVKFPDGRNFFTGSQGTGAPAADAPRP